MISFLPRRPPPCRICLLLFHFLTRCRDFAFELRTKLRKLLLSSSPFRGPLVQTDHSWRGFPPSVSASSGEQSVAAVESPCALASWGSSTAVTAVEAWASWLRRAALTRTLTREENISLSMSALSILGQFGRLFWNYLDVFLKEKNVIHPYSSCTGKSQLRVRSSSLARTDHLNSAVRCWLKNWRRWFKPTHYTINADTITYSDKIG